MGQVVNKTAASWQLEKLYESTYFDEGDGEVVVPDSDFAACLLQLPRGTLSIRWQKAILLSSIHISKVSLTNFDTTNEFFRNHF